MQSLGALGAFVLFMSLTVVFANRKDFGTVKLLWEEALEQLLGPKILQEIEEEAKHLHSQKETSRLDSPGPWVNEDFPFQSNQMLPPNKPPPPPTEPPLPPTEPTLPPTEAPPPPTEPTLPLQEPTILPPTEPRTFSVIEPSLPWQIESKLPWRKQPLIPWQAEITPFLPPTEPPTPPPTEPPTPSTKPSSRSQQLPPPPPPPPPPPRTTESPFRAVTEYDPPLTTTLPPTTTYTLTTHSRRQSPPKKIRPAFRGQPWRARFQTKQRNKLFSKPKSQLPTKLRRAQRRPKSTVSSATNSKQREWRHNVSEQRKLSRRTSQLKKNRPKYRYHYGFKVFNTLSAASEYVEGLHKRNDKYIHIRDHNTWNPNKRNPRKRQRKVYRY